MRYFPFTIFVPLLTFVKLKVMSKKFKDLVHLKVYDKCFMLISDEIGERTEMIDKFNSFVALSTTYHFDNAKYFQIVSGNHILYAFADCRHRNMKG